MPTLTICNNPNSQNNCLDIRITETSWVDDIVYFRDEVDKIGFTIIKPYRESQDTIVWTLQRPYGELISNIHLQQLSQAAKNIGINVLQ